jgi:hypothetical protein
MSITMLQKMSKVQALLCQLEQEIQIELEANPNQDYLKIAKVFLATSKSNFNAANKIMQPTHN